MADDKIDAAEVFPGGLMDKMITARDRARTNANDGTKGPTVENAKKKQPQRATTRLKDM